MNLGFKSKAKAFFVDTNSPPSLLEGPINVILSPSMYWVKRVKLPVKYLYEVKSLIPSLFEDFLPDGKYSYHAYKEDDSYLIFAYNDKEILDLIASKGISSAQLKNIYLAQSEFTNITAPIKVSGEDILSVEEGVVVKLPTLLAPDAVTMDLIDHQFSKQNLHLTRINQIADKKAQITFGVILITMILLFATEWIITSSKVSTVLQKQGKIFETYSLAATSFQNEAIQAKLNNIFIRQSRIRDIFNQALSIKLPKDMFMQEVVLEKNKVVIVISTPTKEAGDRALSKLKKSFKQIKTRFDNGTYIMEVAL